MDTNAPRGGPKRPNWLVIAGLTGGLISPLVVDVGPAAAGVAAGVDYVVTPVDSANFPQPTTIDNEFYPITPGTQLVLHGTANRGVGTQPHTVIFTATDLTKVVDGIRTVVVWDQDIDENGVLQESELALFAQDRDRNVWNLGEYPEEYTKGKISGAPSTWLSGRDSAVGGMHVHGIPVVDGTVYLEGKAPKITFLDVGLVESVDDSACGKGLIGCYDHGLRIDEWDPLAQPDDGHQLKHYARGIGVVRVDPVGGGVERESLELAEINHLSPAKMDDARKASLALDDRARKNKGSIWSKSPVSPVERSSAPGAPQAVLATATGRTVHVSWQPPSSDGWAQITGYTVIASPGGARVDVVGTSATFDGLTPAETYTFGVTAHNIVGPSPAALSGAVTIDTAPPPPPVAGFVGQAPARLMDTRPGSQTADGVMAGIGVRGGGSTTELQVAGRGGVPVDAVAVSVNVTAVDTRGAGYFSVWPCDSAQPNASLLNFVAGATVANGGLVKIGAGGKICLFTSAATDVIVDTSGFFPAGAAFTAVAPARLADTRSPGGQTIDGRYAAIGARAADSITEIEIAGRPGVPVDVRTVAVNVTVVDAQGAGYVSVWPCSSPMPNASLVNFAAGDTVANSGLVTVGAAGTMCLLTSATTDVIVDLSGYFGAGAPFVGQSPSRLMDSRSGGRTVDGIGEGGGARPADSITEVVVAGRGEVPAGAGVVALNIIAVGPAAAGYLTAWPCGSAPPNASLLNFAAGNSVANGGLVKVGDGGKVCVFMSATTDLIVDVGGYFPG